MTRSYLVLASALLLCAISLGCAAHAETRYFRGQLDDQLSVREDRWTAFTWHAATADEIRRLGLQPDTVVRAYAGECTIPDSPKSPLHGRIVELRDGRTFAYLDVNRDGSFGPDEGAPLEIQPASGVALSQARFLLPLSAGAYTEMPVLVALPSRRYPGPPSAPGTQRVLIGATAYVGGRAQLSSGRVLMRFAYSPPRDAQGSGLDTARAQEWMDLDQDGKITTTPGSPEVGNPHGGAPVFHFKDQYLQVTRIDPETRTFTLRTVPASAYHRIAMGVGDKLPDFQYRDFADRKRHLSDVKGKYRLLNFWSTWCSSCINQLPEMKAIYDRYHEQGFEILGLNADENPDRAEDVMDKFNAHWPEARLDREMSEERFQIFDWPTNVLIDRTGKVIALLNDNTELNETLDRLLP